MKKAFPTKLNDIEPKENEYDQPQMETQPQKEGGFSINGPAEKTVNLNKKEKAVKESKNKSRRSQQKSEATEVHEYILDDEGHKWIKPKKPEWCGYLGESLFLLIQVICIICYACFTKYGIGMSPDTPQDVDASGYDPHRDVVQNLYPFFQDVHVMIFIGFGFLMSFIKTMSWTALAFNWIVSIWALQWAILCVGFFH